VVEHSIPPALTSAEAPRHWPATVIRVPPAESTVFGVTKKILDSPSAHIAPCCFDLFAYCAKHKSAKFSNAKRRLLICFLSHRTLDGVSSYYGWCLIDSQQRNDTQVEQTDMSLSISTGYEPQYQHRCTQDRTSQELFLRHPHYAHHMNRINTVVQMCARHSVCASRAKTTVSPP